MIISKSRIYWIILLLLFFYTQKRYDIDDNSEMPYNVGVTVDKIV
jgi:hypothetical protein